MASTNRLPSGLWRAQIRRRSTQLSRTFRLKSDAVRWAAEQEARIDRGETLSKRLVSSGGTLGDLIESHMADMAEVGNAAQRSKEAVLLRLQRDVGKVATTDITREMIIDFGRRRAKEGAGPVTLYLLCHAERRLSLARSCVVQSLARQMHPLSRVSPTS